MRLLLLLIFFTALPALPALAANANSVKDFARDEQKVLKQLDDKFNSYSTIAEQIWQFAELGYQEKKTSKLLQKTLMDAGFKVKTGVAELPTAFIASYGSGKPIIAVLAEMDALPGISQSANPHREQIIKGGNGHACGHHLFGTGSIAAAIAIKSWLQKHNKSGTIRLIGTPAEEGGAGKVYMVRAGVFDDVDATLHWHPSSRNSASAGSSLSNKSAKFRFHGIAAHAAIAPDTGRSALDGVEAMNFMTNLMREHMPSEARMHYVITNGGRAPNVVPEFAEVFYYVRHPEMRRVKTLFKRVVKAAEAAASGTGTTVDYEVIHGLYNILPNDTLNRVMYNRLSALGGIRYNSAEKDFAQKIMASYAERNPDIKDASIVNPYVVSYRGSGGSTDVGDVSWAVPTAGLRTATWVPGTKAHTWQAVAAGGMSIGHKGMLLAAKVLALTAIDIYRQPKLVVKAKAELVKMRGKNFKYRPLLGDRDPPFNYRE